MVYMKMIRLEPDLYQQIKEVAQAEDRTLQAQVNRTLRRALGVPNETPPSQKNIDVSDLLKNSEPTAQEDFGVVSVKHVDETVPTDLEFECCRNETRPCKHWVWDSASGEGYRNLLSGRFREAE